jgi:hypothetical protein
VKPKETQENLKNLILQTFCQFMEIWSKMEENMLFRNSSSQAPNLFLLELMLLQEG